MPDPDPEAGEPRRTPLERVVHVFIDDPALRPVLIVLVLIAGTFVAGAVMLALTNRNLFAIAGLAGLGLLTLLGIDHEIRAARRMTLGAWGILSVWIAAAVIGGIFFRMGAF